MMQRKRRKKKNWSYNAGERGRNWVRAFQQARDGRYYLEWFDEHRKRRAVVLKGVTQPARAKARADELAAKFAMLEPGRPEATQKVSLAELLDRYQKEVTPTKGSSQRKHDRRARRIWLTFFAAQPETGRRSTRRPETLDRIDWDRFIAVRRAGQIPGWSTPVGDRTVALDLVFLLAVLNWAVGARAIAANPWGIETRRAQRWPMPKEKNPHRPSMTDEIRTGLIKHGTGWQFPAMLLLGRETLRRNSSIRQLRWGDIDLKRGTIRWRARSDKAGRENVTPMTPRAAEVIRGLPTRGIGDLPLFPGRDGRPTSKDTGQLWLKRAKARWIASVPEEGREELRRKLRGVGYHAEKRAGVRARRFRDLPVSVQEELAGTNFETLRQVYDRVTVEDMRAYWERTPDSGRSNCEHQLRAEGAERRKRG